MHPRPSCSARHRVAAAAGWRSCSRAGGCTLDQVDRRPHERSTAQAPQRRTALHRPTRTPAAPRPRSSSARPRRCCRWLLSRSRTMPHTLHAPLACKARYGITSGGIAIFVLTLIVSMYAMYIHGQTRQRQQRMRSRDDAIVRLERTMLTIEVSRSPLQSTTNATSPHSSWSVLPRTRALLLRFESIWSLTGSFCVLLLSCSAAAARHPQAFQGTRLLPRLRIVTRRGERWRDHSMVSSWQQRDTDATREARWNLMWCALLLCFS